MQNILLLGDSIRQNYQSYVKEQLREANVFYPNDNGRSTQFTLLYFHRWWDILSEGGKIQFDVVHFNCGLWDILRLSNENEPFTPEDIFRRMLTRIYERIKFYCPDAKIVFALTTSVIEPGYAYEEQAKRYNHDIERYNRIAIETFDNIQDVDINDLYAVSISLPHEAHSDFVHFETDIGIKALGNQVLDCLRRNMK